MDFQQICRICLESNKEAYDIYTCYYVKRNTLYADMLSNCTKLKPNKNDGLPRLICRDCSRQLKRTYAFNIQCEESDIKLRTCLKQTPIITKSNFDYELLEVKRENSKEELLVSANSDIEPDSKSTHIVLNNCDEKEIDQAIKLEPVSKGEDPQDSCWDADDDDILLDDIKSRKELTESACKDEDAGDSCWDADDDNILLENFKANKELTEAINDKGRPKKKRGRKRKYDKSVIENERQVPESKLPHQCEVCGKFLSTKSNLKAHKICHSDLRPFKCDKCPSAFRGHSSLSQHKKLHTGETPYHCQYCPKQFRRRTGLVNHVRMHTGEKLFSCDICFKSFVQSAQLSIHMKRHKGEKPYLCQDCGKGFPIKADLKVHQRIHNGEKPYSCHLCNKTFATSGNLSIHVRIHNKEVRYKCKECQRGFVTCSAYNVHLKRHKGQRDYRCECGKTFYTSSALKQHKVVHTGEKNYKCKICDRKFSQSSHLGRHFKRDHAKSNAPVPSTNYYKLIVVPEADKPPFDSFDVQKMAPNEPIKCEGS